MKDNDLSTDMVDTELDIDDLDTVSGGYTFPTRTCRFCGKEFSPHSYAAHLKKCPLNPHAADTDKAMGLAME